MDNPIIDQELIKHIDSDFFKPNTDSKLKELKVFFTFTTDNVTNLTYTLSYTLVKQVFSI